MTRIPPKPADYQVARYECDIGYSCHLCFSSAPFSDKFPAGKHWPCDKHWQSDSWDCLSCKQFTWSTWGSRDYCKHCCFPRYGNIKDVDPLVRLKNRVDYSEIESMADNFSDDVVAKWKAFLPPSVMNQPRVTIYGDGRREYYPEIMAQQEIFQIMTYEPCTLRNIVAVKLYSFLSKDKISADLILKDVDEYYESLESIPVFLPPQ